MNPQDNPPQPVQTDSPSPRRKWPWRFILLVTVLATGVAIVSQARRNGGQDLVPWRHSYDQATLEADKNAKPLLALFTADWCPACKQMKAWVFSDPKIAEFIEAGFVPVKIDLTTEGLPDQYLADRYGVTGIPSLIALTPDGKPISISTGYVSKNELTTWLNKATERYAKMNTEAQNPSATEYVEVPVDKEQNP